MDQFGGEQDRGDGVEKWRERQAEKRGDKGGKTELEERDSLAQF